MYDTSHSSVSAPMNGLGGDLIDGSGTINPAALNSNTGMSHSLFLVHFLFYPGHAPIHCRKLYGLVFCYFSTLSRPLKTDDNNNNNNNNNNNDRG